MIKINVFFISRSRSLQPWSRFLIWSDPGERHFGGPPPSNFDPNPHLYSGLSQRRAGCHACLWTDQIPDLRIYVVIAVWGPSFVPKSQVSSFSGGPGKAQHPSLTTSLYYVPTPVTLSLARPVMFVWHWPPLENTWTEPVCLGLPFRAS